MFSGFSQKSAKKSWGGALKKSVKLLVSCAVLWCPGILSGNDALGSDSDVVKEYFGITTDLSGSNFNNDETKTSTNEFYLLAGQQVVGTTLTGVFVCKFKLNVSVNHNCSEASGSDGGGDKRCGHINYDGSNAQCQWFCVNGWTGANTESVPDDGNAYTQWLKKEQGWCGTNIEQNKAKDLYNTAGHMDNVLSASIPITANFYNPDDYGKAYKNWKESGHIYNYNTLGVRYIRITNQNETGVTLAPVIFVTHLDKAEDIDNVKKSLQYKDTGSPKTFCLPGYTGDGCQKIPEPKPCGGISKPTFGTVSDGGWRDVTTENNNGKYQTNGHLACVCPSTTDVSGCRYRLVDSLPTNNCSENPDATICRFVLGGVTAYYYKDGAPSANSMCRCKPGYYGTATEADCLRTAASTSGTVCTKCETPSLFKDKSKYKWTNNGYNSGTAEQMCNVVQLPTGDTKDKCSGDKSWYQNACYELLKDNNDNYFILPQSTNACGF